MGKVQESIEIGVPVRVAYNQWTQFEEFPLFMEGVKEVRQLDDTHLLWVAKIGGKEHSWEAEITEQRPDERIAWRSVDGKTNAGLVTFRGLDGRTEVTVDMEWDEEGLLETLGSALGADERRVKRDLERFKELIESRGRETGAWRGEVEQGRVTGSQG
ncbi:MAG TPA: SRPBCC family protein [Gaiellaceae bacterium]|nr:SRPBCC family protein [Gaiellaceae bacterium]